MFIVRTKTDSGINTFSFKTKEGAEQAAGWIMKTSAAGFIAEAESADSMKGKILQNWDHKRRLYADKYSRKLEYDIKYGRYRDTVYAVLGTEDECLKMSEETNAEAVCWASTHCHVEHLVGPLWQCVYTEPYTD